MTLMPTGFDSSHTGKTKHAVASSTFHTDITLSEIANDDLLDRTSHLLSQLGDPDIFGTGEVNYNNYFSTEADVSTVVSAALTDAKRLAERRFRKRLHVYREFSLWSDRPDHLVLHDESKQVPIIAVEDKIPFPSQECSEDTELIPGPVLGQMYDYIMEMRCLGHCAPFVVLSTFEKSWMFWQSNKESCDVVQAKEKTKVASDMLRSNVFSPNKQTQQEEKTPSPPGLTKKVADGDIDKSFVMKEFPRDDLRQTVAFDTKDLVPLLYTAIVCGLARNPFVPKRHLNRETFHGIALQLKATDYKWVDLTLKVGSPVYSMQGSSSRRESKQISEETFFVTDHLGRGDTSKVFSAYDREGTHCVIKMYVKRTDENRKFLSSNDFKLAGDESCKKEADRLKLFYPFLEGKVFSTTLNGFPCVIMPYFRPLKKNEREQLLEENCNQTLCTCLDKFVAHKLQYDDSDIRWRHLGYYTEDSDEGNRGKEKLVMFDLADLEELDAEDTEDIKKFFTEKHIEILRNRLPKME
jgi:hypothetical protein